MHEKAMVRSGYDAIAYEYLTTRSEDSEDVLLLQEIVTRLPESARILDAGCGAGFPHSRFCRVGITLDLYQIAVSRARDGALISK